MLTKQQALNLLLEDEVLFPTEEDEFFMLKESKVKVRKSKTERYKRFVKFSDRNKKYFYAKKDKVNKYYGIQSGG